MINPSPPTWREVPRRRRVLVDEYRRLRERAGLRPTPPEVLYRCKSLDLARHLARFQHRVPALFRRASS